MNPILVKVIEETVKLDMDLSGGAIVHDMEGNAVFFTKWIKDRFEGRGSKCLSAASWMEDYSALEPKERKAMRLPDYPLLKALGGKESDVTEMILNRRSDKYEIRFYTMATPLYHDGFIQGAIAILSDSEDKLLHINSTIKTTTTLSEFIRYT